MRHSNTSTGWLYCRLAGTNSDLPEVVGGAGVPASAAGSPVLDLSSFRSMAAVRLPELPNYPATPFAAQDLRTVLRHDHRIEVRILHHDLIPESDCPKSS